MMDSGLWVFDVDGCLIDALTGTSLRPGAAGLLRRLRDADGRLLLWSAGGSIYAHRRAVQHSLESLFEGFYSKDLRDADGYYRTDHLPLSETSATFVDDQPGDLRPDHRIIPVSPYLIADCHDTGLSTLMQ